jgi:hypothetical protein
MSKVFLALALAVWALPAYGASDPVFQMDFSDPALSPSHWSLTFHPDGNGHFHSERGKSLTAASYTIEAPDLDRDIQLSRQFAERAFQVVRQHRLSSGPCESHLKVAFQGRKKMSYAGPEGTESCEFNYAKDKEIQALGESMVAVAETILSGARLELLLQHDRLGLDKETEFLVAAVGDGRVQQLCAIRGILERLTEDPSVMERVRKRARVLLAQAER